MEVIKESSWSFGFDNLEINEKQKLKQKLQKEENFRNVIKFRDYLEEAENKRRIWSHHRMGEISGIEWEEKITELYNKMEDGKVTKTQKTRDGGKDIIVEKDDGLIFVEIKDWENGFDKPSMRGAINAANEVEGEEQRNKEVKELHTIAPRGFTKPAKIKANKKRNIEVRLIDGDDLLYLLNKYDVEAPY